MILGATLVCAYRIQEKSIYISYITPGVVSFRMLRKYSRFFIMYGRLSFNRFTWCTPKVSLCCSIRASVPRRKTLGQLLVNFMNSLRVHGDASWDLICSHQFHLKMRPSVVIGLRTFNVRIQERESNIAAAHTHETGHPVRATSQSLPTVVLFLLSPWCVQLPQLVY